MGASLCYPASYRGRQKHSFRRVGLKTAAQGCFLYALTVLKEISSYFLYANSSATAGLFAFSDRRGRRSLRNMIRARNIFCAVDKGAILWYNKSVG